MRVDSESNNILSDLMERLEKRRYQNLSIDEQDRIADEKKARALRDEYELREIENRRIGWLNSFYQNTQLHGLPLSADMACLANLDTTGPDAESFNLIRAWRPGDLFGFVIVGPAGSGKSFALQALAKSIMFDYVDFSQNRRNLIWFSTVFGLDKIRSELDGVSHYKKAVLSADYLFIDDLGAEKVSEWAVEQLYLILDYRLSFERVTFISSNCSLDELKARYHERFVSRLKETSVFIQIKGKDRRNDKMKNSIQTLKSRMKKD